jgi:HK97 family phage portal protein
MFLNPKASYDDGDRSPWGSFWFSPVPFKGSPHQLTADAAMRLTAVYACVRVLAESVSMLPFNLYREGADGSKKPEKLHWLYALLAQRPNSFQNPMEYREMCMIHLGLRGNAFSRIVSNSAGIVTDLIPIHPDRVTIEMLGDTNWRYHVRNSDQTETPLNRGQMFHIRAMSSDGVVGINPIAAAREAIATGLSAQDYGMRYFQNDATPGGWIEYPGQFKDDEQKRQFRERWQAQQGGRNRHKTAILEFGMKYHPIEVSNADAQFLETRKFSVSEVARLFRIPPHMIGDLDKATFSNIEQQSLEFVMHTLTPWLVRWEEAIRYSFIDPEDSLNVEFPTRALLRGDAAARSTYYHNGILDGWMTRNEARLSESLNPLDGLDEPLLPLNMVEEKEVRDGAQPDPDNPSGDPSTGADPTDNPTGPTDPSQPDPNDTANSRLFALADAAAARVARKETAMAQTALLARDGSALRVAYDKHAPFVAAALSVSMQAATDYCDDQCAFVANNPNCEVEQFETSARFKLARLALKGAL